MPTSYLTLNLSTDHAVPIQPGGGTATVTVTTGASVYYSTDSDINSTHNEGTLVLSTPVALTNPVWLLSAGVSTVTIQFDPPSPPGGGASGALTLLSATTLSSPGLFDVSGISGAYSDLVLVMIARSADTVGGATDRIEWRFNNDVAGHYYYDYTQIAGSAAVSSNEFLSAAQLEGGRIPASGGASIANGFGISELTLYGYASTVWLKPGYWHSFVPANITAGNVMVNRGGGFWNSTAAITRVGAFLVSAANFAAGSKLRIYGRL